MSLALYRFKYSGCIQLIQNLHLVTENMLWTSNKVTLSDLMSFYIYIFTIFAPIWIIQPKSNNNLSIFKYAGSSDETWAMNDVKPCFMCANLNMRLDYEHAQFIFLNPLHVLCHLVWLIVYTLLENKRPFSIFPKCCGTLLFVRIKITSKTFKMWASNTIHPARVKTDFYMHFI